MLNIKIKITGDEVVARKLKALGEGINDLSNAMQNIGEDAIRYYASVGFTDRGLPFESRWPDYSVQYKKWKEKHYAGKPMLIRSGKMQEGFYATVTRSSVTIDNKMPYYKYHQSSAARTKMPRRPMAGINGNILDMVKSNIRKEISRKIEAA